MKTKFWAVGVALFLVFCVAPASALAGSISGKVTDAATGLPMGEVTVCADAISLPGVCVGVPESGEYTLGGLQAGEYRVSFQPNFESNFVRQYYPGTLYYEDATLVAVGPAEEDLTGIDAAILEGATVTGTVVGEGEDGPLEEVEACAKEPAGPGYEFCGRTGSDGTYRIPGVPAGSYKIVFENEGGGAEYATRYYDEKDFEGEADEVELEAGREFTADATMVRAGAIAGGVTEDGHPLEWASVCAYTLAEVKVGCVTTEEDGSYRWEDLPVGSYILELERFGETLGFSGGAKTFAAATPVAVEAGATATENFEVAGPPGISGTVVDAATGEAPEEPVQACASAEGIGTNCWQINGDGTYSITGLEPAEYLVYFESDGYVFQYYDGVTDEADATLVTVGESMVTGIDAELDPAGTIAGHVTLASDGTNLKSVEACAMASGAVVECRPSRTDGTYEIPSLPTGDYTVRFTKSGYVTQYFNGKATAAEADTVSVQASATTGEVNAAMVKAVKPSNVTPPELSGVGKVGETLSCTKGVWANSPTSYEFYWLRNGSEIRGAEADTYKLVAADAGKNIKCGVLAANNAGHSNVIESTTSIVVAAIRQLTVATVGSGTVTSNPAGIECGTTCSVNRNEGEVLTLTATPAAHFQFTGWSGVCTGTGSCEVTLGTSNSNVTAVFAELSFPVTVTVTGAGSVSSDTAGTDTAAIHDCTETGGRCEDDYYLDQDVHLVATPDARHELTGWTGCTTESGDECDVTVAGAQNVTATFAPITHRLSVAKSGDGSGTVTSAPSGIECGATCAASFDEESSVTLTAVPDPGSAFTGWSGDGCSGTATCVVTLGEDANVVADFAKKPSEGGNGGATPPASTTPAPIVPAPTPPRVSKPKPLKCKKGFRKATKKGKVRCVKVKGKTKGGKGKGSGKRG